MKFTLFTQATLAIPMLTGALAAPAETGAEVKRAACSLEVKYIKNWVKSGLDRYRFQLITNPRDDRLLKVYCDLYIGSVGLVQNKQCGWGDHYYLDGSVARGVAGHRAIRDSHFNQLPKFELITGCKGIRNF